MKVVNLSVLTTIVIVPNPNVTESATICRRLKISLARRGNGRERIRISETMFIIQSAMNSFLFQNVQWLLISQCISKRVPHQNTAIKGAVSPKMIVRTMTAYNARRNLDATPAGKIVEYIVRILSFRKYKEVSYSSTVAKDIFHMAMLVYMRDNLKDVLTFIRSGVISKFSCIAPISFSLMNIHMIANNSRAAIIRNMSEMVRETRWCTRRNQRRITTSVYAFS
jgi:hypothetical protein